MWECMKSLVWNYKCSDLIYGWVGSINKVVCGGILEMGICVDFEENVIGRVSGNVRG